MQYLITYVEVDDKEYCVSTRRTFDAGLETMVFKSKNHTVIDWLHVYVRHYSTEEEAYAGHNNIVESLKANLGEGVITTAPPFEDAREEHNYIELLLTNLKEQLDIMSNEDIKALKYKIDVLFKGYLNKADNSESVFTKRSKGNNPKLKEILDKAEKIKNNKIN